MKVITSQNRIISFDYDLYGSMAMERAECSERFDMLAQHVRTYPDDAKRSFQGHEAQNLLKRIIELGDKMVPMQDEFKRLMGIQQDYDASLIRDLSNSRLETMGMDDRQAVKLLNMVNDRIWKLCEEFIVKDVTFPRRVGARIDMFRKLSAEPIDRLYLQPDGRKSLVRAFIWATLIQTVFAPAEAVWAAASGHYEAIKGLLRGMAGGSLFPLCIKCRNTDLADPCLQSRREKWQKLIRRIQPFPATHGQSHLQARQASSRHGRGARPRNCPPNTRVSCATSDADDATRPGPRHSQDSRGA